MQLFQSEEVGGDVVADRGMRAATGFNGTDALGWKGVMTDEKFPVFFGEDVIRNRGQARTPAQFTAKLKHQGCFATADGAADPHGERALGEIPVMSQFAFVEVAGVIEMFVGVQVAMTVRVMVSAHIGEMISFETGAHRAGRANLARVPAKGQFGRDPRAEVPSSGAKPLPDPA